MYVSYWCLWWVNCMATACVQCSNNKQLHLNSAPTHFPVSCVKSKKPKQLQKPSADQLSSAEGTRLTAIHETFKGCLDYFSISMKLRWFTAASVRHAMIKWVPVIFDILCPEILYFDHTELISTWISPLLIWWWCHQIEIFSMFVVLCEGNSPVTGGFPQQRPVMWSFDVFFDLSLNK